MAIAPREGLNICKTSAQCGVSVSMPIKWRHRLLNVNSYHHRLNNWISGFNGAAAAPVSSVNEIPGVNIHE